MTDVIELSIQRLLKGLPLNSEEAEICDFTLEDQNSALETQGVVSSVNPNYKPVLGQTVTFIVASVIINEKDEVLMMQEAKSSCAGQWYLPAGRMEKNEDILTAAKREVLEETGLEIECTSLLMVESAGGSWIRFVMTGVVKGGTLKTPMEADKESLQAKWISNLKELKLRAEDVLPLIDRGRAYMSARKSYDKYWHSDQLPALRAYSRLLLRLVIVIVKRANNKVHILLSERTAWHLPACELHPTKSIHSTLRRFMIQLFGAEVAQHRPHGLLSVEHDGRKGKDGACLTMLVAFRPPLEEVPILGKCVWQETSKDVGEQLLLRIAKRNSTLPVNAIC